MSPVLLVWKLLGICMIALIVDETAQVAGGLEAFWWLWLYYSILYAIDSGPRFNGARLF